MANTASNRIANIKADGQKLKVSKLITGKYFPLI